MNGIIRIKKIFLAAFFTVILVAGAVQAADTEKITVIFKENITSESIREYIEDWKKQGVEPVMLVPVINGAVIKVPPDISTAELSRDKRVNIVEKDQPFRLNDSSWNSGGTWGQPAVEPSAVSLMIAERAAGDGGVTSFVMPVGDIPEDHRSWGMLRVLGQPYDDQALTGIPEEIPDVVAEARNRAVEKGLRIAVFDSGIALYHENIAGRVAGGIDLVNMVEGIPFDDNDHGTHVAGLLFARLENSAAPFGFIDGTEFYSVKVIDENAVGDVSTLIMGIQWALDNDIDVINLSVAYRKSNRAVKRAFQKAYEAGIIMVAAVGNHSNWDDDTFEGAGDGGAGDGGAGDGGAGNTSNRYTVMYPARYSEVIAVGSIDQYGIVSDFCNEGGKTDIFAPGNDIVSLYNGGGFGVASGTSMAVPFVTAAVTLMKGIDDSLTPGDIRKMLRTTAVDDELNLVDLLEEVWFSMDD